MQLKVQVRFMLKMDCFMTVSNPSQDDKVALKERLSDIPPGHLVEEVLSRWDEILRLEGQLLSLRHQLRHSTASPKNDDFSSLEMAELEERLRVSEAKNRQVEGRLQNEKLRRAGAEADSARFEELQEENSRLIKNEEELLLLILDMETQIERLVERNDG